MKSCVTVNVQGKRVSCQNGRCKSNKGHTRKLKDIGDKSNCEHIQALNANKERWATILDETSEEEDDADELNGRDDADVQPDVDMENIMEELEPDQSVS